MDDFYVKYETLWMIIYMAVAGVVGAGFTPARRMITLYITSAFCVKSQSEADDRIPIK